MLCIGLRPWPAVPAADAALHTSSY
jgi:hypothetical protein